MILLLSDEELVKRHRKMWHWIADETEKQKRPVDKKEYIKKVDPELRKTTNECYLCENTRKKSTNYCQNCPLVWPNENTTIECSTFCAHNPTENEDESQPGLYLQWSLAMRRDKDYKLCAKLARQIANLPERK